ncbi:DUF2750 domain-containing protein [Cronobacter universalis]|uniref:DUF2750 domain-containing protein n=1 Tax=Cronobacter universalis TaxID=535744 RepID=UPI003CEA5DF6
MKPPLQEINALFNKDGKERYQYFIKHVVDWECAWTLKDAQGFVTTEDADGKLSLPLWPAEAFARKCAIDEWIDIPAISISLDELMDDLLPDLIEDNIHVIAFMAPSEIAVPTLSAIEVLNDLTEECNKY